MAAPEALGAQTVVRRYRQRQEESSSSSSGGSSSNRRQLMFSWGEPPAMLEAAGAGFRAHGAAAHGRSDAAAVLHQRRERGRCGHLWARFDSGGGRPCQGSSRVHRLRIAALPHEETTRGFLSRLFPSLSRPSHPCELAPSERAVSPARPASECSVRSSAARKAPGAAARVGSGPALVERHGVPLPALVRLGYRVIAPDLPGYGRSPGTVLVANAPAALLKAQGRAERNGDDHDSDDESDEGRRVDGSSCPSAPASTRARPQADGRWPAL